MSRLGHHVRVPRVSPAALSLALAAVLTLAAYSDVLFVTAVIVLVQVLVAMAPSPADERGRTVSAPRFGAAIVAGAVATALTVDPSLLVGAPGTVSGSIGQVNAGTYAALIPAASAGVMVALVSQMFRRDRRALVPTLGYAVALVIFAALPVGWVTAARSFGGPDIVAVCAAALVGALLVWQLPVGPWLAGALAAAGGAVGGAVAAGVLDSYLTAFFGFTIGIGVGLFAVLGQVLGSQWVRGRRHASAGWGFPGAMSIVLVAPVVHLAGQMAGSF